MLTSETKKLPETIQPRRIRSQTKMVPSHSFTDTTESQSKSTGMVLRSLPLPRTTSRSPSTAGATICSGTTQLQTTTYPSMMGPSQALRTTKGRQEASILSERTSTRSLQRIKIGPTLTWAKEKTRASSSQEDSRWL